MNRDIKICWIDSGSAAIELFSFTTNIGIPIDSEK